MNFNDHVAVRTIWGEARGESDDGKLAVAHVIRNRVINGRWGNSAASVCLSHKQFSCWNPGDPNRRKMIEINELGEDWETCLIAWEKSWDEIRYPDPTGGAHHYKVVGTPAAWADGQNAYCVIGHHEFFCGIS